MWTTITADNAGQHVTQIAEIAAIAQAVGRAYASFDVAHIQKFLRTKNQATILFYSTPRQQLVLIIANEDRWFMYNVLPGGTFEPTVLLQVGQRELRRFMDDNGVTELATKTFIGRNDYDPAAEEFYTRALEIFHELDHPDFREVKTYRDLDTGEEEVAEVWIFKREPSRKPQDELWHGRNDVAAIRTELRDRRQSRGQPSRPTR